MRMKTGFFGVLCALGVGGVLRADVNQGGLLADGHAVLDVVAAQLADSSTPTFSPQAAAVAPAAPAEGPRQAFHAGQWTLGLTAGAYQEYNGKELVVLGGPSVSYYLVDDFALIGEFMAYGIDNIGGPDAEAVGFNLIARWHFVNNPGWSMFLEGGAGVIQGNNQIPYGGTHFNFTPQAGVGFTIRLADNLHLILAGRYFHLSNASIEGVNHNPSIDAFGGYAGIVIEF